MKYTETDNDSNDSNFKNLALQYSELSERYEALFTLNKLLHECADIKEFYHQVHEILKSLMTADNFAIALCDRTFETIEYVYYHDDLHEHPPNLQSLVDINGSITHYLIEKSEPIFLSKESIEILADQNVIERYNPALVDWLGVPLVDQGVVIGLIRVLSYNPLNRHLEQDLDLLHFIAQQINAAISRFNDQEQLKRAVDARTRELMAQIRERERSELLQESLYKISELSNNSGIEIDKFYYQVHNIVGQLINAENFYIARHTTKTDHLNYVFMLDQQIEKHDLESSIENTLDVYTKLVLSKKQTVLLTEKDIAKLSLTFKLGELDELPKSWLGVPLMTDGEIIGAMVIQSYQENIVYSEQDAELLNFVARHVSSAMKRRDLIEFERKSHELLEEQVRMRTQALQEEIKQRRNAEEQLTYAASHDSLTGLPNRSVFLDLLNHAIACKKRKPAMQFALLFLDLDRFKVVNDSLGHHAGDALLKIISKELKTIVREKDTVARLGGDEFVILIEDLTDTNEAFEVADRITRLLNDPIIIENTPVFIGTSIGVLFSDERYKSADVMLRDADTAMYQAKEKGKGRYEVFDTSMQLKVQNALTLEADIREAITLAEFIPYFQPIVRLDDNKIVGFEALARWESYKRGFVYPNDFIPIAEDTGLVKSIDLQILEKSCIALKEFQKLEQLGDIYVSCNLFCDHFFSPSLPQDIIEIINRVGVEPTQVRIELTERALLDNKEIVLDNMQALKKLGLKILLDDFGTGYSSLSYLHRFPIDVLKIDRSFITNIHDQNKHRAIIKTIIDLAANLNMTTVGEGIENLEDAQLLNQMDCKYGQGFYFAKPMSGDDVLSLKNLITLNS
ncbi:MAG: sensor domain-containing phosphodiesterase [Thalassotalea sp.]